jgi:azurin
MKFHHFAVVLSLTFGAQYLSAQKAKPAAKPESKSAAKCDLAIEGTDQMQYQIDGKAITSIDVPSACKVFTVTLKHVGKLPKQVMGHNFVVTASSNAETVNSEATKQGPDKGYLPNMAVEPFKSKVIATGDRLLGGGESEEIRIDTKKLKKGGDYSYFCTFPGHFGMMKGKLNVK